MGLADFKHKFVGRAIFNREILGRKENHYYVLYEIYSDDALALGDEAVDYESFSKEELTKQLKSNPKKFGDAFLFVLRTFYLEMI